MGAVTFALRFAFFSTISTDVLPQDVEKSLPYILPAALMAIIVPGVVLAGAAETPLRFLTPYLIGAIAGFAVGVFFPKRFWTIVLVAMTAFLIASVIL